MPRKRPARIRAEAPRLWLGPPIPTLPGLSPRGRIAVACLERARFWPGAAAQALATWTAFLRDPGHRFFDPGHGCGELGCCPDPEYLRGVLEAVAYVLPRRDARALRRRLAALDDLW